MSYEREGRSSRSGKGSRLPWILAGCGAAVLLLLLVGAVLAALMLPALSKARESARRAQCKAQLRQIGVGAVTYAADHDGKLPPDLESLMPEYIDNPRCFVCPSVSRDGGAASSGTSYTYVPGLDAAMPGGFVLACDADVRNHHGQGFNVLFVDAHVEWWPASRREEFDALLEAQKKALENIRKDPGNREKYLKEYGAKHAPSSGWGARGAPAR